MGLDILFLLLFGWAAFKGFSKGLILQLASLLALILGIYGAIKFSAYLSNFIKEEIHMNGEYLPIISFAIAFIVIVILIHLLARVVEKMIELVNLGIINRIFGAIFNMIKFALIISIFLVILYSFDQKISILSKKQIQNSFFYKPLLVFAPFIYPYFRYNFFPNNKSPDNNLDEIQV
jgi:membrane protein required for colicin V production